MTVLSIPQILAVAANAGFQGPDLATAVAVALAESSGNPTAYNPEVAAGAAQGQGSYGLWQIYLSAHPQFDPSQLLNPQYNANAAYTVYSQAGGTFRPWTTYTSGAYSGYLAAVNDAIGPAQASPDQVATDTSGDGSGNGNGTLDLSIDPTNTTILIGAIVLGAALWFLRG